MKGVQIRVQIGPYEAGSMTLGAGGVNLDVEAEEAKVDELTEAIGAAVSESIKATTLAMIGHRPEKDPHEREADDDRARVGETEERNGRLMRYMGEDEWQQVGTTVQERERLKEIARALDDEDSLVASQWHEDAVFLRMIASREF